MSDEWLAGIPPARPRLGGHGPADLQREAERVLLNRYAPPSVLVNEQFEIQHFRGRTSPFLETPTGQPTTNILRMAREGLFMELRSALAEAKATRVPIVREGLRVPDQGSDLPYTLRVLPVSPPGTQELSFLVLFETTTPPWTRHATEPTPVSAAENDVEWLRRELALSKQYLQTVVDQHDVVAQDLRAAHEEVLSSNEELKSTNEELETTKEELQSANEELTTVNEQYRIRNSDLNALTDDLSNFISSADLPMVTVGPDLCVRRLTPAATRAFNLLPSDVGRSINHIKFALAVDDIGSAIDTVLTTLHPWKQQVADRDGRWWLLRVQPYRTADNRIDGATIVAVDIDPLKRREELVEERDYARAIVQTVREPLAVLDDECRVSVANEAFYALFGTAPEHVQGRPLWDSAPGVWADRNLRARLLATSRETESITNLEIEVTLGEQGRRTLVLNARPIVRSDRPARLLLAIEDVTSARAAEALRIDAETLRQVNRRKDEFLGILAHELRNPLAPMRFALELMRRSGGGICPNEQATASARSTGLPHGADHRRSARCLSHHARQARAAQGSRVAFERRARGNRTLPTGHRCRTTSIESVVACRDGDVACGSGPIDPDARQCPEQRVKFTPPGGHIYVVAEIVGETHEHPDQVRVRIRDDGIGIAPELRPKIFDMFAQGDRSLERTRGGLGVGLTLVRNLAHLHGGSVDVRSDGVDSGTEVILDLPIERSAQSAADDAETASSVPSARALRILVADDNEDAREMMRYFLESEGHTVATAGDGPSALAAVEEFRPEVAVLDIGMPGLNGYKVAEQIRHANRHQSLTLVALSGLGQAEDKRRATEAGFDVHFTKPIDIPALTKLLASIAAQGPGRPVEPED